MSFTFWLLYIGNLVPENFNLSKQQFNYCIKAYSFLLWLRLLETMNDISGRYFKADLLPLWDTYRTCRTRPDPLQALRWHSQRILSLTSHWSGLEKYNTSFIFSVSNHTQNCSFSVHYIQSVWESYFSCYLLLFSTRLIYCTVVFLWNRYPCWVGIH